MLPRRAFPLASIMVFKTQRHADFDLFQIRVRSVATPSKEGKNKGSWLVFKRFSQFQGLYESIKDDPLCTAPFPSVHMFTFGRLNGPQLEERRQHLDDFMQQPWQTMSAITQEKVEVFATRGNDCITVTSELLDEEDEAQEDGGLVSGSLRRVSEMLNINNTPPPSEEKLGGDPTKTEGGTPSIANELQPDEMDSKTSQGEEPELLRRVSDFVFGLSSPPKSSDATLEKTDEKDQTLGKAGPEKTGMATPGGTSGSIANQTASEVTASQAQRKQDATSDETKQRAQSAVAAASDCDENAEESDRRNTTWGDFGISTRLSTILGGTSDEGSIYERKLKNRQRRNSGSS